MALTFLNKLSAGESIASEGKGEYMWCEGRILDVEGKPVPNCKIETWETDDDGLYVVLSRLVVLESCFDVLHLHRYDTQYEGRTEADCRGRLTSDENGYYSVGLHAYLSN